MPTSSRRTGRWSAPLVGYDRYQSQEALAQLNRLYPLAERYVNFFQPVMQLQEKHPGEPGSARCMMLPELPTAACWSWASFPGTSKSDWTRSTREPTQSSC